MLIGIPRETKPEENRMAIVPGAKAPRLITRKMLRTMRPGAVPPTSTRALTLNTLPYVLAIVEKGLKNAARENPSLARGINLIEGKITYQAVAEAFNLIYSPLTGIL